MVLIKKNQKLGLGVVAGLFALSFILQIVQNAFSDGPAVTPVSSEAYLQGIFNKPWIRMGPYLMGIWLALKYFSFTDLKQGTLIERHQLVRYSLYLIGLISFCAIQAILFYARNS